jgi:tetratricopeptide (TPR) repeat protein
MVRQLTIRTAITAFISIAGYQSFGWGQSMDRPPTITANELASAPTWNPPGREEFETAFSKWLDETGTRPETIVHVKTSWLADLDRKPPGEAIDAVIRAIVIVRPDLIELHELLKGERSSSRVPDFRRLLESPSEHAFVRNHLRLYIGRWLAQNEFYDEAIGHLEKIEIKQVLDPMTLLFYRGLMEHQLLRKDNCLKTINQLLEHPEALPRRYETLSRLMLADIQPLEPDSLDEISRMMGEIRRRTGLNRSGKLVLSQEEQVIEKLDKLIKKLESQQQPQSSAGVMVPGDPMNDSIKAPGKGSGQVTSKPIKDGGSWGDLPPAQRAAALAEMAKDMPPHYREVIEEYFRRLAKENDR